MSRINREEFARLMQERVLVLDGAMGTSIQGYNLTPDDFLGGKGNNDILNLTRGDVIEPGHG